MIISSCTSAREAVAAVADLQRLQGDVPPALLLVEAAEQLRPNGGPHQEPTRHLIEVTADGVRMARKPMYFTSAKAERELGYRSRPAVEGLRDAIDWYRSCGYLR
jgi:dihydroflavonol-4-reductase